MVIPQNPGAILETPVRFLSNDMAIKVDGTNFQMHKAGQVSHCAESKREREQERLKAFFADHGVRELTQSRATEQMEDEDTNWVVLTATEREFLHKEPNLKPSPPLQITHKYI